MPIFILATLLWLVHLMYPQAAGGESASRSSAYEQDYHSAWRLLKNNTLYEDKLALLSGWEHKFDGQLDSQAATDQAIASMVQSLGDDYTYFRDPQATAVSIKKAAEHGVVNVIALPNNVAWIKIRTFSSEHTANEVRDALLAADSADAYVLDLRDNKGGDIYEAFAVAAMFMDRGNFARLEGRLDGAIYTEQLSITDTRLRITANKVYWDEQRSANLTGTKPLIVLVNKATRSAAEMLAGALRENHRCLLVGEKTYGKGVVQKIFPLPDGSSLKIVIAKNYLPSGHNVHGTGLVPDVIMTSTDDEVQRAVAVLHNGEHYDKRFAFDGRNH